MKNQDDETDKLLARIEGSEDPEVGTLLAMYRPRIRRLMKIRMQAHLAARVDASDVVQETLLEASRLLPRYVRERPIGFYPWLRQIAINRLDDAYRKHVVAQQRSVFREEPQVRGLPDQSQADLANRLLHLGSNPSRRVEVSEVRKVVRKALANLPSEDREVLVLKYLEEMTAQEVAEVLGVAERTVWRRHSRAIEQLSAELSNTELE